MLNTLSPKKVVIIDDEPITRMDLKEILTKEGYVVVGEGADGFDAVEVCKNTHPDIVLMDIKMPLLDGFSAARVIFEESLCDTIIMLTAYREAEFLEQAKGIGIAGYLIKPVDEKSLMPSIEVAVARSRQIRELKKEFNDVKTQLESRKVIEKAKGYIMQNNGLSEQEAYDYLKNLSLNKKLSMRRVSEMILLNAGA